MAKPQTTSNQLGLTRGKTILIGVLAVALVGVLYVQYGRSNGGGDSAPDVTIASRTPTPRPSRSAMAKPEAVDAQTEVDKQAALLEFDQVKWKSPELPTVIAYDPFALPAAFPQPPRVAGDKSGESEETEAVSAEDQAQQLADALEELRTQLDELKQRGVQVIVSHNDQYVAMIGDRLIHVGDDINGFTVTGIDLDGVRVERKTPE